MRRYKTETRTGLVALYDIRPWNGAGQFLQPRSPHGADIFIIFYHVEILLVFRSKMSLVDFVVLSEVHATVDK